MLSDPTGMTGGEWQALLDTPNDETLARISAGTVPEESIAKIQPPPAGFGLFMRGSEIYHTVSRVENALPNQTRISMVNSYQSRDVFRQDSTRLHSQRNVFGDAEHICHFEFARHKAHRVAGQLECFSKSTEHWQSSAESCNEDWANALESAGNELTRAAAILRGEISDSSAAAIGKANNDRS